MWKNREVLEKMRSSTGTPRAIEMFQKVGPTPNLEVYVVVDSLSETEDERKTVKEECNLIDVGFESVCDVEGTRRFYLKVFATVDSVCVRGLKIARKVQRVQIFKGNRCRDQIGTLSGK